MSEAVKRHDQLLRSSIESCGGYVFKTVGDEFCATFTAASDAIRAAAGAQRALFAAHLPAGVVLRVRMALHTGECDERDGDYFGPAVNLVARLMEVAHGGQMLVSHSTADLVHDRPPAGTHLVDLGSHLLRDLDRSEAVFQLVVDGVPSDFPPLRTRSVRAPTNLTASASSFMGREVELVDLIGLLGQHRLVTLAGAGGAGKTRLAVEVGWSVLPNTREGVWMADLSSVTDDASVALQVVGELGIAAQPGRGALETLVEVLAVQDRLVILDNCEHVLHGAASTADAVLRGCPGMRLLATSREPLRIDGEVVYRVPSLSLPPSSVTSRNDVMEYDAVALFVERASSQSSGFELTDDNAAIVSGICRRLDGMPLAVELAAARLSSMSVEQLHDRLEHRFKVLTRGNRLALPRHQTLEALVDWSYELLTEAERSAFRRSSVFLGDFSLEAAEDVCSMGDVDRESIADLFSSLVDKSLLVATSEGGDVRFRLQETLHAYAAERFTSQMSAPDGENEADRMRAAHANFFLTLAEGAGPKLEGPSFVDAFRQLEAEDLNLRGAIIHAIGTPEGSDRVLRQFWSARAYWGRAQRPAQALELLVAAKEQASPVLSASRRVQLLYCESLLLFGIDVQRATDLALHAADLARAAADPALEAYALFRCSDCLVNVALREAASIAAVKALAISRDLNDPIMLGRALVICSVLPSEDALPLLHEGLALVKETGDAHTAAQLHEWVGFTIMEMDGDLSEARGHVEAALSLNGRVLSPRTIQIYWMLGDLRLREGDAEGAEALLLDVLRSCWLNGAESEVAGTVWLLALCATARGAAERAAVLHGGNDSLMARWGGRLTEVEVTRRDRDFGILQEQIGDKEFQRLHSEGVDMSRKDIVSFALQ